MPVSYSISQGGDGGGDLNEGTIIIYGNPGKCPYAPNATAHALGGPGGDCPMGGAGGQFGIAHSSEGNYYGYGGTGGHDPGGGGAGGGGNSHAGLENGAYGANGMIIIEW